jgi:hypothetical protein
MNEKTGAWEVLDPGSWESIETCAACGKLVRWWMPATFNSAGLVELRGKAYKLHEPECTS